MESSPNHHLELIRVREAVEPRPPAMMRGGKTAWTEGTYINLKHSYVKDHLKPSVSLMSPTKWGKERVILIYVHSHMSNSE